MFKVVIRSCQAPKSGGGKYRRPVRVIVVNTNVQDPSKPIRKGIVREWYNVDSRYDGPNSEYGKALAAATELASKLNAQTAITI